MSKAASSSAGWAGAPPVASDGFAFSNGDFYAEASGQNRHRRATPAELKTHFASGSDKDHPAHWFEAQLLHYGLKPSKTKSVARMRLYDAVNAEQLKVPATITLLESSLKKEWIKKDREAKKATEGVTKTKPAAQGSAKANATKPPAPTKRKRGADEQPKKTKATPTPKAQRPSKNATATPTEASQRPAKKPKPTFASRGGRDPTAQASSSASAIPSSSSTPKRVRQTARRGGISQQGSTRQTANGASASETPRSRTIQTARCSRGRGAPRSRGPSRLSPRRDHDDAPPPYTEFDYGSDDRYYPDDRGSSDGFDQEDEDDDAYGLSGNLSPLGLLNGCYEVTSADVSDQWSHYDEDAFDLVLTISGTRMWGRFDIGVVRGVMLFDERPRESSDDKVRFEWRGEEDEGSIMYQNNEGYMRFLGGGRIEGYIDFMSLHFQGRRLPGQGTRSEVDARTMERTWDGYSEEEYERMRVARWH